MLMVAVGFCDPDASKKKKIKIKRQNLLYQVKQNQILRQIHSNHREVKTGPSDISFPSMELFCFYFDLFLGSVRYASLIRGN